MSSPSENRSSKSNQTSASPRITNTNTNASVPHIHVLLSSNNNSNNQPPSSDTTTANTTTSNLPDNDDRQSLRPSPYCNTTPTGLPSPSSRSSSTNPFITDFSRPIAAGSRPQPPSSPPNSRMAKYACQRIEQVDPKRPLGPRPPGPIQYNDPRMATPLFTPTQVLRRQAEASAAAASASVGAASVGAAAAAFRQSQQSVQKSPTTTTVVQRSSSSSSPAGTSSPARTPTKDNPSAIPLPPSAPRTTHKSVQKSIQKDPPYPNPKDKAETVKNLIARGGRIVESPETGREIMETLQQSREQGGEGVGG